MPAHLFVVAGGDGEVGFIRQGFGGFRRGSHHDVILERCAPVVDANILDRRFALALECPRHEGIGQGVDLGSDFHCQGSDADVNASIVEVEESGRIMRHPDRLPVEREAQRHLVRRGDVLAKRRYGILAISARGSGIITGRIGPVEVSVKWSYLRFSTCLHGRANLVSEECLPILRTGDDYEQDGDCYLVVVALLAIGLLKVVDLLG